MTVGTKLHQCLASAEGVAADLKTFALETQDQTAKKEFSELAQQMDQTVQRLRAQVNRIEQKEPQYKVYQQAIQQGTQQYRP